MSLCKQFWPSYSSLFRTPILPLTLKTIDSTMSPRTFDPLCCCLLTGAWISRVTSVNVSATSRPHCTHGCQQSLLGALDNSPLFHPPPGFSECSVAIHKKCIDKVIATCTGSAINRNETMVSSSGKCYWPPPGHSTTRGMLLTVVSMVTWCYNEIEMS